MKEHFLTISISLSLCLCLGGCNSPKIDIQNIPCPPKPIYPQVSDIELSCLTDRTYNKLADMIIYRDEYINELRTYCDDRD